MTLHIVKSLLPAHSPTSAVYAALEDALDAPAPPPPFKKVLPPVGHQSIRRPRTLSEKQKKTFLGEALKRIKAEAYERTGKYLRDLDTVHQGGGRTRAERWLALAAVAEPLLARLDIATGVLGYLDNQGQFRLNRQNGLAQDAGISPSRLCRLLKTLEKAKYTLRKIKRLYRNGKRWVCRITIYVRPRFFHDLGLGFQHADARTAKAKAYKKKRRQAQAVQQQAHLDDLAAAHDRRMSHRNAEAARSKTLKAAANSARIQAMQHKAGILSDLAKAHPDKGHAEVLALYQQLHPAS
ncbi:hypothetical protein [Pseudomonas iridis]|uniref:hypothetical protein n=1 Tax=Pseudomonas iridis TaxID=2710587 RepID=UPI001B31EDDB|nr:hypothetical protein [Pseudomonas iridis]MBP5971026.1 hypothetical protein [Pseudomonas iridis]